MPGPTQEPPRAHVSTGMQALERTGLGVPCPVVMAT